jgi:hypothetical protein
MLGRVKPAVAPDVVVTVRVPVPAEAPVMLTGDVAPRLAEGGSIAPVGEAVSAAVRVTLPVKPPLGVTVMIAVLPVVEPGEPIVTAPLGVNMKFGATYALTVTLTVVCMVIAPDMPVTVTA